MVAFWRCRENGRTPCRVDGWSRSGDLASTRYLFDAISRYRVNIFPLAASTCTGDSRRGVNGRTRARVIATTPPRVLAAIRRHNYRLHRE